MPQRDGIVDKVDSEEEDFMSDKFIQQSTASSSTDKPKTYSESRKRKLLKASTHQTKKSQAQREVEAREEGLGRNLMIPNSSSSETTLQTESHTKALKMMLKMGFQPGTSLGATNSTSKPSNNDPINIVPKLDRSGVGVVIKSKKSTASIPHFLFGNKGKQLEWTEEKSAQQEAFLEMSRTKFDSRKVEGILSRACRTCEELDRRSGVQHNALWLQTCQESPRHTHATPTLDQLVGESHDQEDFENDASIQEEEEREWFLLEPSTRLCYVLKYLRHEYFYCIWCGCQFESLEELESECPGEEEENH